RRAGQGFSSNGALAEKRAKPVRPGQRLLAAVSNHAGLACPVHDAANRSGTLQYPVPVVSRFVRTGPLFHPALRDWRHVLLSTEDHALPRRSRPTEDDDVLHAWHVHG